MTDFKTLSKLTLFFTFFAIIFTSAAFTNAYADESVVYAKAAVRDYSPIARTLSQKLKTELADESLSVKLKSVEESRVTSREVVVKGEAICILPAENTQLPLQFEAKFDKSKNSFEVVNYVFVDGEYAPVSSEEVLMKELMQKIGADYQTSDITIAIDAFELTKINETEKGAKGAGEIRVGDLVWNKLTFDIILNDENKASKIVYKIEEH